MYTPYLILIDTANTYTRISKLRYCAFISIIQTKEIEKTTLATIELKTYQQTDAKTMIIYDNKK